MTKLKCVHRYLVDEPHGRMLVYAECRKCGKRRRLAASGYGARTRETPK